MKTRTLLIGIFTSLLLISFTLGKKPSLKFAQKTLNKFCNFVPSGNAMMFGQEVSVQAFYMSSTEITNIQYQEFLHDLKRKGEFDKLKIARVDTSQWINDMGHGENYANYYHRHPAYHDYPVVNVSREGAELFCEWLTAQYDSLSNGEMKINFRIPTHAEWMRGARGANHLYKYTWGGPFIRNKQGNILANFLGFSSEHITRNKETGKLEVVYDSGMLNTMPIDIVDVTAPAQSYYPNDFGMYNMNGNVSEMVSDKNIAVGGDWRSPGFDIRNESYKEFAGPNPTVGFRVVASHVSSSKE